MRLLFLTETIPFPLDSGGRIKTYHTLRILSQEHEVHCHAFIREEAQRRFERDLTACCHSITLHTRGRSLLGEARSLVVGYATGIPFSVRRHFDGGVLAQLRTQVGRCAFDAVYCDHLSMLEYGRRLHLPIIYDAHNVEFDIIRRHAATLRISPMRGFAEVEWRMLRRYERTRYPHCGLIYSVSDVDAGSIRRLSGDHVPVAVVPISVDTQAVAQATPLSAGHELLFVGGLHWPPNADAVAYFIGEMLPIIRSCLPDVHLTVVGRTDGVLHDRLRAAAGVTFAGHVPDIEPFFRRSRAMVVPIRSGSGMRVKILDALARGMPTVTTSVGCEGIAAISGTHLLIADTPEAFAAEVVRVLTEDDLALSLSARSRELARNTYDQSVVGRQTLAGLNRLRGLCPSAGLSSPT
jgi:glycosyltransferase involved in cell wall biosynthesis